MPLSIPALIGNHVELEPIKQQHFEQLQQASLDDRIWTYNSEANHHQHRFEKWFNKAMSQHISGESFVFVVRHKADNVIIGTTRYYEIDSHHKRLSIGFTWYHPNYWSSAVNPECKFLLLQQAFEQLAFNRVAFHIDLRNERSQNAVAKLGAQKEGILRKHIVFSDGYIRDTVVLSIINDEWLLVKENLLNRLANYSSR